MTSKETLEIAKRRNGFPLNETFYVITQKELDIIEKDLEELETYRNEKYKHWNIFFNGAKLEYLLYLEQKGKESFMTSISEELFSKIKKHFIE